MKVFPGATPFQAAQGLKATPPPDAAARREALIKAALGIAEHRSAQRPHRPAEPPPPASPPEKPHAATRRGALLDICV